MDANTSLRVAAAYLGGLGRLALKLDLSRQAIYKWRDNGIPLKRALEIERLTEGRVKASDLCPGVFNGQSDSKKQSASE
jgi:DNA-binding transcriptional regulator YdaS (Cro superfamily)